MENRASRRSGDNFASQLCSRLPACGTILRHSTAGSATTGCPISSDPFQFFRNYSPLCGGMTQVVGIERGVAG